MAFYFDITKNIQFWTRKFPNFFFYAFCQFDFLYTFLVGGNLISKYEQLLILTDVDASTLCNVKVAKIQSGWRKDKYSLDG
jgi:hypothetical protein